MPEQLDVPSKATPLPADTPDAASAGAPGPGTLRAKLGGIVRTARPKQWAKNVLVFAAPAAAGVLTREAVLLRAGIAFVAFCLAASGTYFLNDAMDADADRNHPTKRNRPVAAGVLSRTTAYVIAGVLMVAALALSAPVQNGNLTIVIAVYLVFTISYSLGLKREPVVELIMVAAGFVLRAVGGAVSANVGLSRWFLIVTAGGALLVVAGKRTGEVHDVSLGGGKERSVLATYTPSFLRQVTSISAAVTITAYCLWAFEQAALHGDVAIWFELSIVPFVLAILRYVLITDRGDGGAPEDVILSDKLVLASGLVWAVLFGLGTTLG